MKRLGLAIRTIYAACLIGASINHVRAIIAAGWLPDNLPLASAVYWSSLTVLDPLAAVLLFVRPRWGIAATIAIILSDVVHNLWFVAVHPSSASFFQDVTTSMVMMSQLAFLLFVAVTAPLAWRDCRERS